MIDARIAVGLPAHPKTKKLIRRIGNDGAAWKLVCLFLWVAANRPNGDLSGLTGEDIELAIDWTGKGGEFVDALQYVGFLEGSAGAYQIHDWEAHNPWAAGSDIRAAKARWNAIKRHHGEVEADNKVPEWASIRASRNATSSASSMHTADEQHATCNAPSPSPSPSPSPNTSEPKGSGEKPPKVTDPDEIIFGYGVPLLTNSGTAEKQARSFLGGLRKHHGDEAVICKLRECMKTKPLQPLEWLAAALPPKGKGSRHSGFDDIDYRAGVGADGRF